MIGNMGGNANPFAATVARTTAPEYASARYVLIGDEFGQLADIESQHGASTMIRSMAALGFCSRNGMKSFYSRHFDSHNSGPL